MRRRHLPKLWLMTDERMGHTLFAALTRLPKGSGIIFRHYSLSRPARAALLLKVRRIAKARRLMLLIGGRDHHRGFGAVTAPVHSIPERIAAERAGARLLFISPVHPTRSHTGARALGRVRFGLLSQGAKAPVIALGGMTGRRFRALSGFKPYGWAAIDGLSRQKRKAVPT